MSKQAVITMRVHWRFGYVGKAMVALYRDFLFTLIYLQVLDAERALDWYGAAVLAMVRVEIIK